MSSSLLSHPIPHRWKAKWIWPSMAPAEAPNLFAYFRKTFVVEQASTRYMLHISADRFYQVFLNGERLGSGPPPSAPWFHYYDAYDLSQQLRPGANIIAVVVHHMLAQPYGDSKGRGRGGLLLEVTDDRNTIVAKTDATWRARIADAWATNTFEYGNVVSPYVECFDARREPEAWRENGFDDAGWPIASVVASLRGSGADSPPAAGPWTKLVPRGIPFMARNAILPERVVCVEESVDLKLNTTNPAPGLSMTGRQVEYSRCEQVETLCMEAGSAIFQGSLEHQNLDFGSVYSPAVVLDFGRIVTAHVRLSLDGPGGGTVDIGYAERLIDGRFNIAVDGAGIADRYILKEGAQVFETFAWKAFRFLKLRFRACPRPVNVKSVEAIVSTYPYEERGNFTSDDATLNSVFDISKATVRLCSNDSLMDTPWREKAQWLGDSALVTLPAVHSCFGDTALPAKFLLQAGQHQFPTGLLANVSNFNSMARSKTWTKTIPDYSLWWIGALLDQFLYSGDISLLHRLYPQVLRILDAHLDYLNDQMLIENMPYWVFIDWADVEKRGICTTYNAIFYRALECIQQMADFKGDTYTANLARDLRDAMRAVFHDMLFDASRGCFADANIDGTLSEKISEHGNMCPIWAGLCEIGQSRELVKTVFEGAGDRHNLTFAEAQPFFMAVVLPALTRAGRMDLALELIRARWGRRMLDAGATSVFECWQENGRWTSGAFSGILNSHSHAWSACPADFLIRHLLGLRIIQPGCRRIHMDPVCTDFSYQIAFPTPLGTIEAECRGGKVTVSAPDSIEIQRKNKGIEK